MNTDLPTTREILAKSADLLEQAAAFERTAGQEPANLEVLIEAHRRWALQDLSVCDQHGCLGNSIGMLCGAATGVRRINAAIEEQEKVAASLEEQAEKTHAVREIVYSRPENREVKTKPYYPLTRLAIVFAVIAIIVIMALTS